MQKTLRRCVVALALCAGGANAADWKQIGSNDQVTLSVDAESVQPVGGTLRQARFMWDWRDDQPTPPRTQPPKTYRSSMIQIVFDCFSKRIADTEAVYFAAAAGGGDVVDRYAISDPANVPFRDPQPGSLDDQVLRMVCDAAPTQ